MEPGHEGREELGYWWVSLALILSPQWSPAMKAGKSGRRSTGMRSHLGAAMEPGHEGREEH